MIRTKFQLLTLAIVLLAFSSVRSTAEAAPQATTKQTELKTEKIHAFAKTYGYARFFHPSDEASLVDWTQLAVFGAKKVLESPENESTEQLLESLFSPIVVDLEFYRGAEKPRPNTKKVPASEILAWQHFGVGLGRMRLYKSARTNRSIEEPVQAGPFANVLQAMGVSEFRGKEIRFRFKAKVDKNPCRLQGWFRVDRQSEERGLFDNMSNRPITENEWAEYEISGIVDRDAELITFGVMMFGNGSGLIDDAHLEFRDGDDWEEIEIRNPDFETGESAPEGWIGTAQGYDYVTESGDVAAGERAMRLAGQTKTRGAKKGGFMDVLPELGEVVDAEIAAGLRVRMPLALPAESTCKKGDDKTVDEFVESVSSISCDDHDVICLANVAIAWNVFQHFYPYFDQVAADWDSVLTSSLEWACRVKDREDGTNCIKYLVAQLDDGHGNVIDRSAFANMRFMPISFGWIENQLVVLASNVDDIRVGDVVTHVDGKEAEQCLREAEELISGSPQWKRFRSTSGLSMRKGEGDVEVTIARGDESLTINVTPGRERPPQVKRPDVVSVMEKGEEDGTDAVYYVDLGRAEPKDVDPMIEKFANAKGIVFDMRGYPRGTQYLFQHMTDEHMQSAQWLVSKQVRPDRTGMFPFDKRGRWEMPPREPRFKGKMIFITNGSAISYAESCMAIVANYKLAEIIGSPTAGANGNVNPFEVAGGISVVYTGMRVINHDNSQHHVYGVRPTYPMEPTIAGIRSGKDELLDKALEMLR